MFITEEELNESLANPKNLANRFRSARFVNGRDINATLCPRSTATTPQEQEIRIEEEESECIEPLSAEVIGETEYRSNGITFKPTRKPHVGRPWLSQQERTRIAEEYAEGRFGGESRTTQQEIAERHGVLASTVSDIVNNTRRVPDTERSVEEAKVQAALDRVRERAIDKLMSGLDHITDEKIEAHNGRDISTICSNMSRVVQNTIPQDNVGPKIAITVYSPRIRSEEQFDVKEV